MAARPKAGADHVRHRRTIAHCFGARCQGGVVFSGVCNVPWCGFVQLVALAGPEHGIRDTDAAAIDARRSVAGGVLVDLSRSAKVETIFLCVAPVLCAEAGANPRKTRQPPGLPRWQQGNVARGRSPHLSRPTNRRAKRPMPYALRHNHRHDRFRISLDMHVLDPLVNLLPD